MYSGEDAFRSVQLMVYDSCGDEGDRFQCFRKVQRTAKYASLAVLLKIMFVAFVMYVAFQPVFSMSEECLKEPYELGDVHHAHCRAVTF